MSAGVMRYDVEWSVAPIVAAYLKTKLTADQQKANPVITFFDPMASEEASRVIVEVPSFTNQSESPANFEGVCKVTVKSRWTKPTVRADYERHFDCTNWTRDALMADTLEASLNASASGLRLDYIQPKRDFETVTQEGWIYSSVSFKFNGYFYKETE